MQTILLLFFAFSRCIRYFLGFKFFPENFRDFGFRISLSEIFSPKFIFRPKNFSSALFNQATGGYPRPPRDAIENVRFILLLPHYKRITDALTTCIYNCINLYLIRNGNVRKKISRLALHLFIFKQFIPPLYFFYSPNQFNAFFLMSFRMRMTSCRSSRNRSCGESLPRSNLHGSR